MSIFKNWLELDLTRRARGGKLDRAIECDDALQELANTIDAGMNAVVVGEPGVGKTALVHELVSRTIAGHGSKRLRKRQVLQISLRRRLSGLKGRHEISAEVQKLFDAIRQMRSPPVLFIRDIGLVYSFDLEDELSALACSSEVILIGEASEEAISNLFEYETALRHRFGAIHVQEPDLDRATRIVRGWAMSSKEAEFSSAAVEQAVALSHRFLSRSAMPRKAIDLLRYASADVEAGGVVTPQAVVKRLSSQYRIPRVLVDSTAKLDLVGLKRLFSRSVVGQEEAVSTVVDTLGVIKVGLTDLRRPLAALLFTGPTGVGKSLIAQTIATRLFGRRDRLIRFNMADYQSAEDALLLFGFSAAQDVAAKRGQLTTRLAGHSLGVLLLDEFEKCHPSVHDRFLQLLDEGEFTNGSGEKVSCRSFIIIVTTNAGHAHGAVNGLGFRANPSGRRGLMGELATHFRFELLNRFDRIVRFRSLTKSDARLIVIAELRRLQTRLALTHPGLTVEVEHRAIDQLVARGYDPDCGARNLRRTIEQDVAVAIARLLVQGSPRENSRIRIVLRDGAIHARYTERSRRAVSGMRKPRPVVAADRWFRESAPRARHVK